MKDNKNLEKQATTLTDEELDKASGGYQMGYVAPPGILNPVDGTKPSDKPYDQPLTTPKGPYPQNIM